MSVLKGIVTELLEGKLARTLNDIVKDYEDLNDLAQGVLNAATDEALRAACEARGWQVGEPTVGKWIEAGLFKTVWEEVESKIPKDVCDDIVLELERVAGEFLAEPNHGELTWGEELKCLAMALCKVAPVQFAVKYAPFTGADNSRQVSRSNIMYVIAGICETLAAANGCFREPVKSGADPSADPSWDHGSHL